LILTTATFIIRFHLDLAFILTPKMKPNSYIREVVTADLHARGRQGDVTPADMQTVFVELNKRRIDTVFTPEKTEDKQPRQIGAFAADSSVRAQGGGKPSQHSEKPRGRDGDDEARGRSRTHLPADEPRRRSTSQDPKTVSAYMKGIAFITRNGSSGSLKFAQGLHDSCKKLGEPLFETNAMGTINSPLKLLGLHSWGQYGGKLGLGATLDFSLFAGLMLLRDIFYNGDKLSKSGAQHRSDNDASWSKPKAMSLRGDLAPPHGTNSGRKSGGKGDKGKHKTVTAAAATEDKSDFEAFLDRSPAPDKDE
jgi:hypothetical protein